ncbi:tyrosine-type recombinase/integrase [Halorientalis marina]|uniref:tyrosine-type recombinase/integrase n=1 Tax=Halorientalis marina TaxID=2931976 RepID=UPI001FF5158B|nr:tyrosine-type recombinase/integrase [Halorientalis marina]
MADSKRERFRSEKARIDPQLATQFEQQHENDDYEVNLRELTDAERDAILEFVNAKDPQTSRVTDPNGSTKSDSTLARYANLLGRLGEMTDFDLTDTSADEINRFMDTLRNGNVADVKDEGLSAGSVKNFQSTLRKFYEYHDEFGIEKGEIALANPDNNTVDERDIFEKDEIQAIRNAANHPRDKALVDLLLYTGQRLSAVLNLRLKDIDIDNGTFYLNEERGDLKGATGKRPLLYAEKAVRTWYNEHPCDDSEAFFITHKYDWENKSYEPGQRLDNSTIYRQLRRIGERAGVEKPMNAHNFRHTFVTVCKRNYGMDNDTIKRLIGHRPDSNIMESTYAHLTDDDVIAAAERATGKRDDEPESPLTPDVCDVCGEVVEHDNAKACPACGVAFTPDAQQAKDKMQDQAEDKAIEVDNEQEAEIVKAVLKDIRENPGEFLDK